MAFFGDNMHPGGNDRPLGDALRNGGKENKVFAVENYSETWKILQEQYCQGADSRTSTEERK